MATLIKGDPRGVFYDLEADEGVAAELTERANLMADIIERVRPMAKAEAAEALGVSQRRVRDLLAGKLSQFSFDELRAMRSTWPA